MGKCFLCGDRLGIYEGALATIDKGEHRQKGGRTMSGVHVCLDCAEENSQVVKYKVIFLSGWKYPRRRQKNGEV